MSVFPFRAFYYYYSPEGDEISAPRRAGIRRHSLTLMRGLVGGSGNNMASFSPSSSPAQDAADHAQYHSMLKLTRRSIEIFQLICHRGKRPLYSSCPRAAPPLVFSSLVFRLGEGVDKNAPEKRAERRLNCSSNLLRDCWQRGRRC